MHVRYAADGRLICDHCGVIYRVALPCRVEAFLACSRAFLALHCDCPRPRS